MSSRRKIITLDMQETFNSEKTKKCLCNGNHMLTCYQLQDLIQCRHKKYVFRFFPLFPRLLAKFKILSQSSLFHERKRLTKEQWKDFKNVTIDDIQTYPIESNQTSRQAFGMLVYMLSFIRCNFKHCHPFILDIILFDFFFRNIQVLSYKDQDKCSYVIYTCLVGNLSERLSKVVQDDKKKEIFTNVLSYIKGATFENVVMEWLKHL